MTLPVASKVPVSMMSRAFEAKATQTSSPEGDAVSWSGPDPTEIGLTPIVIGSVSTSVSLLPSIT